MPFPPEFLWGAATSAVQIEGAVRARGRSIWDAFCDRPGTIKHNDCGLAACDHVQRFAEDVALMKQLGLRAYRFSIAWPRVLSEGVGAHSEAGLGFYDRLVDALLEASIEPICTLYHWDMPIALARRGGWLNPSSPYWFAEYTQLMVDRLSDRVRTWVTINEPQVFIGLGLGTGEHAPGLRLPIEDQILASHHVMMAHGLAARTILERARIHPSIGWAPVGLPTIPASEDDSDIIAAKQACFETPPDSVWSNAWFNDPVVFGAYPERGLAHFASMLPPRWERDLDLIRQPLDFFGCNIYRGRVISADSQGIPRTHEPPTGSPRTGIGWEITPEAMYWGARFFYERYTLPILICENGCANPDWIARDGLVHDPQRIDYTARHLEQLERAIADGVPVMGYLHWSLMDNFEWAEGYTQRFGLVFVDFETQQRLPKDSARWYANIIATNGGALHENDSQGALHA